MHFSLFFPIINILFRSKLLVFRDFVSQFFLHFLNFFPEFFFLTFFRFLFYVHSGRKYSYEAVSPFYFYFLPIFISQTDPCIHINFWGFFKILWLKSFFDWNTRVIDTKNCEHYRYYPRYMMSILKIYDKSMKNTSQIDFCFKRTATASFVKNFKYVQIQYIGWFFVHRSNLEFKFTRINKYMAFYIFFNSPLFLPDAHSGFHWRLGANGWLNSEGAHIRVDIQLLIAFYFLRDGRHFCTRKQYKNADGFFCLNFELSIKMSRRKT